MAERKQTFLNYETPRLLSNPRWFRLLVWLGIILGVGVVLAEVLNRLGIRTPVPWI